MIFKLAAGWSPFRRATKFFPDHWFLDCVCCCSKQMVLLPTCSFVFYKIKEGVSFSSVFSGCYLGLLGYGVLPLCEYRRIMQFCTTDVAMTIVSEMPWLDYPYWVSIEITKIIALLFENNWRCNFKTKKKPLSFGYSDMLAVGISL